VEPIWKQLHREREQIGDTSGDLTFADVPSAIKREPLRADRTYQMSTNKMALKLAKRFAKNKWVRKVAVEQFEAVADHVARSGTAALARISANHKNRLLAEQLARQIGGTSDKAIIAGDWYWVVWQGKTPFEVYPPLSEGLGSLAERRELQNYQGISIDPSADS
jgi:hypothetical protein